MEPLIKGRHGGSRDVRWPHTVAARVDARTLVAINSVATERGEPVSTILRELIETALGRIDVERPMRRLRAPVRDAPDLASALRLLRTMAAHLCRQDLANSTFADPVKEFAATMSVVQDACARLRTALGDDGRDP